MGKAQDAIKGFMQGLVRTDKSGIEALDEAIAVSSHGRFDSFNGLVQEFASTVKQYSSTQATQDNFLQSYCDIDMDNDDTGAITGSDAGGSVTQLDKHDIMPETDQSGFYYHTGEGYNLYTGTDLNGENRITGIEYTDIQGKAKISLLSNDNSRTLASYMNNPYPVTVDTYFTGSQGQQIYMMDVVRGEFLNEWAPSALDLIYRSYGLTLHDATSKSDRIWLTFMDKTNSSTLATTTSYSTDFDDLTRSWDESNVIMVNMSRYDEMKTDTASLKEGAMSNDSVYYLDRTIAHEMTHVVMQSDIACFDSLPHIVQEGLAELTHGADDTRKDDIYESLGNIDTFVNAFQANDYSDMAANYAASYVLFRYFAKQVADYESLMSPGETLTIDSNYKSGSVILGGNASDTVTFDASKDPNYVVIYGNNGNNILRAGTGGGSLQGQKGNDRLFGNTGTDKFWFYQDDGHDVVYNYESNKDQIYLLGNNELTGMLSGSDVVLTHGKTQIYLADAKNKYIRIYGTNRALKTIQYYSDGYTYDSENHKITIGRLFAKNRVLYGNQFADVVEFDASQDDKRMIIYGNNRDNILRAGKSGSSLQGQGGNDTIYCGDGLDDLWFHSNDGSDTVYNYGSYQYRNSPRRYDTIHLLDNNKPFLIWGDDSNNVRMQFGKTNILLNQPTSDVQVVYNGKNYLFTRYNLSNKLNLNYLSTQTVIYGESYRGVTQFDARENPNYLVIYGNSADNWIYASKGGSSMQGQGGNDVYYGNTGRDKFWFALNDGTDWVYNFESNKDEIHLLRNNSFTSSYFSYVSDGKRYSYVALRHGDTTAYIENAKDKFIPIYNMNGSLQTVQRFGEGYAYDSASRKVTIKNGFGNNAVMRGDSKDYQSVREFDARQNSSERTIIYGNNGANIIRAGSYGSSLQGQGGNDTIYAGSGKDDIWFHSHDGADTIYNFGSGQDVLHFMDNASYNAWVENNDVMMYWGSTKVTLKGAKNATIQIAFPGSSSLTRVSYTDSTYMDLPRMRSGSAVHGNYYQGVRTFDASKNGNRIIVYGNNRDNVLRAGNGGSSLQGQGGNDTIYGGNGVDDIWFHSNDGSDTVYNFESNKDVLHFLDKGYSYSGSVSGRDVRFTFGKTQVTLKDAAGKKIRIYTPEGRLETRTYGGGTAYRAKANLSYLYDNNIVSSAASSSGSLCRMANDGMSKTAQLYTPQQTKRKSVFGA